MNSNISSITLLSGSMLISHSFLIAHSHDCTMGYDKKKKIHGAPNEDKCVNWELNMGKNWASVGNYHPVSVQFPSPQ